MREYTKRLGTVRIAGTDWPRDSFARRGRGRTWICGVRCNGVEDSITTHHSYAEAVEAAKASRTDEEIREDQIAAGTDWSRV